MLDQQEDEIKDIILSCNDQNTDMGDREEANHPPSELLNVQSEMTSNMDVKKAHSPVSLEQNAFSKNHFSLKSINGFASGGGATHMTAAAISKD